MSYRNKKTVLVIPTTNTDVNGNFIADACGQIRILNPLAELVKQNDGYDYEIIYPDGDVLLESYICKFDFVWTNRTALLGFSNFSSVLECINRAEIKLILDLDDALLKVDMRHPEASYYLNLKSQLSMIIGSASMVSCSTDGVSKDVKDNFPNTKTRIVRNSISDDKIFEIPKKTKSPVICYYGTNTHKPDFKMIEAVLFDTAERHPTVKFPILGVLSEGDLSWAPSNVYIVDVPLYSRLHYRSFMSFLYDHVMPDYVLAPLVDNEFNKSKSELKALEALSIGAIPILSKGFEYDRLEKYLKNNELYCESVAQWRETLNKAANGTLDLLNFDSDGCWVDYSTVSMSRTIFDIFENSMI